MVMARVNSAVRVTILSPGSIGAPAKAGGAPKGLLKKAPADADDLKAIKGLGPKAVEALNGAGVYMYAQLSGFSEADLEWLAGETGLAASKLGDWSKAAADMG